MAKLYLSIAIHFHQPVGNFRNILERAYENCYRPFLETFEKYPDIKMAFHFSGCLLDYIEEAHPEFLDRVKDMVDIGRVELLSGGYYEPIFPAIPHEDRLGQIKMLSFYIKKRFGKRPLGMWIPERVWSPELVLDFSNAGIYYSILDDTHFIKAGLRDRDLHGYFITHYRGKEFFVFPSSKRLRYTIPFKMPVETIDYLRGRFLEGGDDILLTYGDDAEKFGEWPGTYDWVYNKRWLCNFFEELGRNKEWIETLTFSETFHRFKASKKIVIPEASYEEMMEWADGSWMNFMKRYPETEHMVRKMHYVSKMINGLEIRDCNIKTKRDIEEARKELYKGQCNCGYWHGVFGGIYLYHLRRAIYEHLINAEKIADNILHKYKRDWVGIEPLDLYKDRGISFIIKSRDLSIYVDPARGGIIRELDHKALSHNMVNTIARHKEQYHKKIQEKINIAKLEGGVHTIHEDIRTIGPELKDEFFYDDHIRGCLIDHFISPDTGLDNFIKNRHKEHGDFVNSRYYGKKIKNGLFLERSGKIGKKDILVKKELGIFSKNTIGIRYVFRNLSGSPIHTLFGSEFNLTMPFLNSDRYTYFTDTSIGKLNQKGEVSSNIFSIKDSGGELSLDLIFSGKIEKIWYFPVETISQSERAYELNYQCSAIIPFWRLNLIPYQLTEIMIKMSFSR